MFEKILLVLILILQAVFSGLIFSNSESSFNWDAFSSLFQSFVLIFGFFVTYFILTREISFKKKLDVHEKITNLLVDGLHKSFYALSPFVTNSFFLEKSNPKNTDDYPTETLQRNSKELSKKVSNLQADFQIFYEFFQFWKALFSEKIDRESKFLFDLEIIFAEDLLEYQRKLSSYSMLSLMKDEAIIEDERKDLLSLEEKITEKSNALANGLDKFVSDMSREVFKGLFAKKKNVEKRLFDSEIENSNDGDSRVILTEKGFVYQLYKKTDFQREFGGFKERQEELRKFLEQK
ncbi:MAG: hypothetical protein PHH40_02455 [Candidatus Moranbacteria bacterium]|nr:hypothetical protein [Candidatus Moranbacteria bacterium]MDD3965238.1 hypothetical protein [Candidatus Moranbacteria bacterium]